MEAMVYLSWAGQGRPDCGGNTKNSSVLSDCGGQPFEDPGFLGKCSKFQAEK